MIEDIEYLKDNCEKDTATFYIDTSQRNRHYYPTPSEFSIEFEQPFRFVNGFDVLDAAIPTTMYNIDQDERDIAITLVNGVNPRESFKGLSDSQTFSKIFEYKLDGTVLYICSPTTVIQGVLEPLSEDVLKAMLLHDITVPYKYFMAYQKQIDNLPFQPVSKPNNSTMFYTTIDGQLYAIDNSNSVLDIIEANEYKLIVDTTTGSVSINYYEYYLLTEMQHEFLKNNSSSYIIRITNYHKKVDEGNYDVSTLRNDMNSFFNDVDIFVENTTTVERKQGKYRFWSSSYIVFNALKSGISSSAGFDMLPKKEDSAYYETYNIGKNDRIFAGLFRPDDMTWAVVAPGLVNLLGERYVILRCKEIESHLLGSLAYTSFTPGIGMFKLAAAYNDITNLRFDFVNLIRKPFHPIGKLPKLTFRFETSSGKLYDFKGVNIQMLLMLKFLVPTQKFKFDRSILNPNYHPDFMQYMSNNKTIQYKEDSDEEEEFDTQKYNELYKKEFNKYDYSTSEDEDTDDDDSEEEVVISRRRGVIN